MSERKAGLLAILAMVVLSAVVVLFVVLGASVWTVHGGYWADEPTLGLRVLATAICLIPVALTIIIIRLLVAIGRLS